MLSLFNVNRRRLAYYLDTNASAEEKSAVEKYRASCAEHDRAREELRNFLADHECSAFARDLYGLIEDLDTDNVQNDVQKCVDLFRDYTSTACDMQSSLQTLLPMLRKVRSKQLKEKPSIKIAENAISAIGFIVLVLAIVERMT